MGTLSLRAAETVISFDELATQQANGVEVKGVHFGFTVGGVASHLATFNSPSPLIASSPVLTVPCQGS